MSRSGLVLRGHCNSQERNRSTEMILQAIPGVRKGCELASGSGVLMTNLYTPFRFPCCPWPMGRHMDGPHERIVASHEYSPGQLSE